ncbi:hypothetical protein O181_021169 [Austropuccinia psidii MF-1]|uniref:Uncharacterized protein n=1 Tax=Austropuccinia psidii MF-1 TaxID=1389203 RepID=A0A9Q3CAA5_9BASI|nr:hypothetical protein [Austropuccinia psidii MF-1]
MNTKNPTMISLHHSFRGLNIIDGLAHCQCRRSYWLCHANRHSTHQLFGTRDKDLLVIPWHLIKAKFSFSFYCYHI